MQHILALGSPCVEIVSRQDAQHAGHDVQLEEGSSLLLRLLLEYSPDVHSRIVHDSLAMGHGCGDRNRTRNAKANDHASVCYHTDGRRRDCAIHPGSVNASGDGSGRSNRHLQWTDEEVVEGSL